MLRHLPTITTLAVALLLTLGKAQEAPTSLDNLRRLGDKTSPLAKALLKLPLAPDLTGAVTRIPEALGRAGLVVTSKPNPSALRIGGKMIPAPVPGVVWWRHFANEAMQPWIDVLEFSGVDAAKAAFDQGRQPHSGTPSTQYFVFLTSDASQGRDAVSVLVRNDRRLFHFGFAIPFKVNWDGNTPDERRQIADAIDRVALALETVTRQVVDPGAITFIPSGSPNEAEVRTLRLAAFARLWSEVKQNFVFLDQRPRLDWDSVLELYLPQVAAARTQGEYLQVLRRTVALLEDGHTGVFPSDSRDIPPLRIEPIQGKPIVTEVGATPEIQSSGIRPGMELLESGGIPVKRLIEEAYPYIMASTPQDREARAFGRLLAGPPGATITAKFSGLDSRVLEARLTCHLSERRQAAPWTRRPPLEFRMLPGGIAYVAANTFDTEAVVKEFDRVFDQVLNAKGLIIDVRNNGGGSTGFGYALIARLIDKPNDQTSRWRTREYKPVYRAWGRPQPLFEGGGSGTIEPRGGKPFLGPVAVLIGPVTYSAAEDFLVPLKMTKRATLVGTPTGGSTGQPLLIELYGALVRICTKWDRFPDGTEFVGVGIQPDARVERTREDVASGSDPVLARAVAVLSR